MSEIVFDSSAVLAMLREEPGGDCVADCLGRATISAVNLQEVAKELLREGRSPDDVRAILNDIDMTVRSHDAEAAHLAAELFDKTKHYGSGIGDRSCMALGLQLAVPILAADRAWKKIEIEGLKLQHLR